MEIATILRYIYKDISKDIHKPSLYATSRRSKASVSCAVHDAEQYCTEGRQAGISSREWTLRIRKIGTW